MVEKYQNSIQKDKAKKESKEEKIQKNWIILL
jgi:hypothetical protein